MIALAAIYSATACADGQEEKADSGNAAVTPPAAPDAPASNPDAAGSVAALADDLVCFDGPAAREQFPQMERDAAGGAAPGGPALRAVA